MFLRGSIFYEREECGASDSEIEECVKSRTEKYVLGIFLDMSGAFDRAG